jgi:DNA repair protein RecO (recombination protein O)
VPTYRDSGVVLRTHKLGEADRIITLLTRSHGRVRAVARGVRRTSSKFGARLEPMGLVDAQFHIGRSLDSVTQVESLFSFGADLASDYPRWTAAQAICETAERLTPEEREPAPAQFQLLVGGLRALAQREHPPGLVLDAYLVRSLAMAAPGVQPARWWGAVRGLPDPRIGHAPPGHPGAAGCAALRGLGGGRGLRRARAA